MSDDLSRKNKRMMLGTLAVVAGMVALAYASVPLYRMFCQVTGWGGTTQATAENHSKIIDRDMVVRFDSSTARDMPWHFKPDIVSTKVKIGADAIVAFTAENWSDAPVTGTAVYNVTPLKAGKYFYKTQCFCFGEQTLNPKQKVHMPVTFYIDPAIADDPNMDDVKTITLSYTFFRAGSAGLDKAIENFSNNPVTN